MLKIKNPFVLPIFFWAKKNQAMKKNIILSYPRNLKDEQMLRLQSLALI